jgi:hypothetical protein
MVVGIFPNEAVITGVVAVLVLERNGEWAVQRARWMTLASIGQTNDDEECACPT